MSEVVDSPSVPAVCPSNAKQVDETQLQGEFSSWNGWEVDPLQNLSVSPETLSLGSRPVSDATDAVEAQSAVLLPSESGTKMPIEALKALIKPRKRGPKATKSTDNGHGMGKKKRGAFTCMEERLQTSKTRQMSSCIRCSLQKIRVSIWAAENGAQRAYLS
jgi:hypothetical protein